MDPKFDISYHAKGQDENHPMYGETWTNKHNFMTIRSLTMPEVHPNNSEAPFPVEGMNDAGLSVGALWFAGYAHYNVRTEKETNWRHYYTLLEYLLGNYHSVQDILREVRTGELDVWTDDLYANVYCPLHWTIHDQEGRSGLLEFTKNKNNAIYNHTRICTNSPDYDWHCYNLGSFSNLSILTSPIKIGHELVPKDLGFGVRGIPGDPFSASRFVRTFYYLKFTTEYCPPQTGTEGMNLAFRLLEGVSVPKGVVAQDYLKPILAPWVGEALPEHIYVFTSWYVAKDLRNLVFTYRTYDSFGFHSIRLKDVKWEYL
eukprot:Phypoly_transcript_09355.p1 GENE.Phypoly_transcript_09355~~Phypoly_transcript_09355.p1  ORF type:complete len:351 (+),score=39.20 Phypoly_transcript_09355:109-1053(+)